MVAATVLVSEALKAEAAAITAQLPPDEGLDLSLVVRDGAGDSSRGVPVPDDLAHFLRNIIDCVASSTAVTVTAFPEVVSTTLASKMLGISRPTLMKLIREGELSAVKVGTHTRLSSQDVLAFKDRRAAERAANFEEMRRLAEEVDAEV